MQHVKYIEEFKYKTPLYVHPITLSKYKTPLYVHPITLSITLILRPKNMG